MGITERINQVLARYGLNNNAFAARMGAPASSTHSIIHGRTKPSYDFLAHMLDTFADVNANWLIRGKGLMLVSEEEELNRAREREKEQEVKRLERAVLELVLGKDKPVANLQQSEARQAFFCENGHTFGNRLAPVGVK